MIDYTDDALDWDDDAVEAAEDAYRAWAEGWEKLTPELREDNQIAYFGQPQPLDEELKPWLGEDYRFGVVLKHPLVFGVPYLAEMNPHHNQLLAYKKEVIESYAAERDFMGIIWAHERPFRLRAIDYILDRFDDVNGCEYWTMLRRTWIDSENIHENEAQWRAYFEAEHVGREFFMEDSDRQEWAMLPDDVPVPIYRGFCLDGRDQGLSWTTDKIKAKWFARRASKPYGSDGTPQLAIGRVAKRDVVGYLNGREESEVVVFPEKVELIRIDNVPVE